MHPQVRSARIPMTGETSMLHRGRLCLTWLTTPSPAPCLVRLHRPPPLMHPQVRSARIAMTAGTAMSTPRTAPPTPPCSPSPYPCPLRSTTPRIAISTSGIAKSTSRSPRLHRRLTKTFYFVLSFFLRTTTILRRPRSRSFGQRPLVAVVAIRPLATTLSCLGE